MTCTEVGSYTIRQSVLELVAIQSSRIYWSKQLCNTVGRTAVGSYTVQWDVLELTNTVYSVFY